MAKRREQANAGSNYGDFWKLDEGDYLVYVHGLVYPDDDFEETSGLNFIRVAVHYVENSPKVCLDPEVNPIIKHPIIKQMLLERETPIKIKGKEGCPICQAIRNGDIPKDQVKGVMHSDKWIFGLTPMFYRKSKVKKYEELDFEPKIYLAGVSVFNDLTDEIIDLSPVDPTDPRNATLMQFSRTGKSFGKTKYKVQAARETTKLNKEQRRIIADVMQPGGDCDIFRVAANLIKPASELRELISGVEVEDEDGTEDNNTGTPDCYAVDYDQDDDACEECDLKEDCKEKCEDNEDNDYNVSVEDDDEDIDEDEEQDDEDDIDDNDDDDDEIDEAIDKAIKSAGKKKTVKKDIVKKGKAKKSKKGKKK